MILNFPAIVLRKSACNSNVNNPREGIHSYYWFVSQWHVISAA